MLLDGLKKGAHIHVQRNTWNLFVVHNMFQKFGEKKLMLDWYVNFTKMLLPDS